VALPTIRRWLEVSPLFVSFGRPALCLSVSHDRLLVGCRERRRAGEAIASGTYPRLSTPSLVPLQRSDRTADIIKHD